MGLVTRPRPRPIEYRVIDIVDSAIPPARQLQNILNALGRERWILAHITDTQVILMRER